MQAKGNGDPAVCVQNLLLITRGTVPYARMKGMDAALVNKPAVEAVPLFEADAEWLIENYEPRVSLESIDLSAELARTGHFSLNVLTGITE